MLKARRSELLLILSALMFASNGIASKLLLDGHITAWRLAQIRAISACAILAIYLWRKAPTTFRIKRSEILPLVSYGVLGIAMVQALYFLAISRMHVSIALLIEFTAPVWIVVYLRVIKRKHVPNQMWLALLLALSGLALIAQIWDGLTLDGIGVIAGFGASFMLAYYFLCGEALSESRDNQSITMWGFFFAGLAWCLVLPVWSFPFDVLTTSISLEGALEGNSAPGWVLILYVVLVGTIFPYLCVMVGLRNLKASTTSAFGLLEPIFVGIIAWFWLAESWTVIQLAGGVVVIAGIYMADQARSKTT
ncbi:MAG: DMT family transporter [Candidatus Planktophila sp.]|nr:DMT family transporter [Candidatus Planktophila sp.]